MINITSTSTAYAAIIISIAAIIGLAGCTHETDKQQSDLDLMGNIVINDKMYMQDEPSETPIEEAVEEDSTSEASLDVIWAGAESFIHGTKSVSNQRYIMLHDTEVDASPTDIATSWTHANGGAVAAHFIIGRDGTIVQCGELDQILHHAGWGGPGNYDAMFGVGNNDGQGAGDDLIGTVPLAGYTSYGMNSYSIGIEMVHVGGQDYPEAQLEALDSVIAYIDAYYGFESKIIDHKTWRPSNSDTDASFGAYLANYQQHRTHE